MQYSIAVILSVVVVLLFVVSSMGYFIGTHWVRQSYRSFLGRYLAVFGILFIIEYAFLELLPSLHATLSNLTATIVGGILRLAGIDTLVSGSMIMLQDPPLAFEVSAACLGGVLFWVYIGLVFAESGVTMRQRLVGIIAGISVLVTFNIFRITLSIYLESQTGVYVHDYFYMFNMVFVILVWVVWLKLLKLKRPGMSHAGQEGSFASLA